MVSMEQNANALTIAESSRAALTLNGVPVTDRLREIRNHIAHTLQHYPGGGPHAQLAEQTITSLDLLIEQLTPAAAEQPAQG